MKIIAISDLHGNLPEITEAADLLILGGDISPLNIESNLLLVEGWLSNVFSEWINSLPVEQVIMIAGNHDYWFERYGEDDNKLYDF